MRHAKTERNNATGDHARVLAPRGHTDAGLVAQYLRDKGLAPTAALVSDATRTRETIAAMLPVFGAACETIVSQELYLAAPETILHTIWSAPDGPRTLLVVGHNPGIHALVFSLAQESPRKWRDAISHTFPTAAAAIFSFDTASWADVRPGTGTMTGFITAKSLRTGALAAGDGNAG